MGYEYIGSNVIGGGTFDSVTVEKTIVVHGDADFDEGTLFVDDSENRVGIGTETPAKNLHIYGASGEVELRIQSDVSYSSIVHKDVGNELIIQNAATDGITIFHDDTAERMRIDKDGNVGIGTNAPAEKFHVVGDAALVGDVGVGTANPAKSLHVYGASGEVELRIQSDTSFSSIVQKDNNEMIIQNAASGGVMIFHDDSAERMRINAVGNVGIGTNAPLTALDIVYDFDTEPFDDQLTSGGKGGGHVLRVGGGTTVLSRLYFLHTDNTWDTARADDIDNGGSQLLGIAMGTSPTTHGMLIQGYVRIDNALVEGTPNEGLPCYVSDTASMAVDFTAPSASGEFVRILGHCVAVEGSDCLIYFNPSADVIELA